MVKPLHKILTRWKAVDEAFRMCSDIAHLQQWMQLKELHVTLMELYSMLVSMTEVITEGQDMHHPTGAHTLARYIGLRTTDFNVLEPLVVKVFDEDGR